MIHEVLIEVLINSFTTSTKQLILDFDSTDDPILGNQEGKFFHRYYDNYCLLPLYVFCKDQLLVNYIHSSNIDFAILTWAILSLLVKRLKKQWLKLKWNLCKKNVRKPKHHNGVLKTCNIQLGVGNTNVELFQRLNTYPNVLTQDSK